MREGLVRKHHRQQALLRVVGRRALETQAELARALRGAGFATTQATISRDIVELGLVKVPRNGTHVYAAPSALAGAEGPARLRRFCEDYPVEAATSGNLVILRSPPGTANALAIALDTSGFEELVGTIAGDDTVFVAVAGPRQARSLIGRLAEYGVRRRSG